MSSILTNNSAMVALGTLRGINNNLASVQSEISTGKKISSSSDNAAIWSIATVMQADVDSFSQVSDSLNLGSATIGVAQAGAEQVTELLQDAKAAIVAANDASVTDSDRAKYQTDLAEITSTISSIVEAASFNGQNLLKDGDAVSVLSSLNRGTDGTVTTGNVAVARQDLTTTTAVTAVAGGAASSGEAGFITFGSGSAADDGGTDTITIQGGAGAVTAGSTYSFDATPNGGAAVTFTYTAQEGDDINDVAAGLVEELTNGPNAIANTTASITTPAADPASDNVVITFTNNVPNGGGTEDIALDGAATIIEAVEERAAGGLAALSDLDISTSEGATSALGEIDALLQTAIDATAFFGSKQSRIDNQNEFITTLADSLKTGIGALTDANLEEASARLQSLQVQQQLGVQALTIANQNPQTLLALFR
ncbi:flagellin [Litorimonas taeanensis]|uniref:Flagellin n=1 Tax=Litorimonas taeanensis TaxID=568099 RepID=A0A420WM82_9PROT|nr:flagellin [Litorimonas taeanensis]RKQ72148.1 flagellin [Litorimonas taeanensis]